jgi:predicted MPP superfamily phosphohydrolase
LIVSLPFSGILNSINHLLTRRKKAHKIKDGEIDSDSRRKFIAATATLFPIAALSAGTVGISGGFQPVKVYLRPMSFKNLPPELEGLRILHLSDSHLGIYRTLKDIEEIMQKADEFSPDLTVITGDFADELKILPEALKIVASQKTRFGAFASLGNHEYYRGLPQVLRDYEKSDVVLFRSSGFSFNIKGATLYLAGADDPVRMGINVAPFLKKSINKALDGAPSEAFYLLMSHRPEALDIAAESGIDLTLAGHTHGGQVGMGGRSFWRFFNHDYYFWGEYTKNESRMYLSSGIGHWLPFRLGCPPEAPIIELTTRS